MVACGADFVARRGSRRDDAGTAVDTETNEVTYGQLCSGKAAT